ncbi:B3 domain-containing protein [Acorus gramineus]|uniref:B3 domain-containing protein n=1 Tax=Acorus gramineus TaxID=55184 RepID=A0AAV9BA78_ACOGR|nr:B3 domain-containing protein [Acorus gramineus]
MYFENGWQEFVRDHSLKCGEILLFRYDGNARFTVLVFDSSACERKDCHSVRPCREVVKSKTSKGAKSARQMVPSSPDILKRLDHRKQHARIKERGNAFEEACSFNSNHPTVVVIMRESYKKRMWLPRHFSKAYLQKNSTEMRLVVPKAGEWSIGVLQCRPGRCILSSGWLKFSESNGLKVGDSLVFELVHKTEMHVHIFRA